MEAKQKEVDNKNYFDNRISRYIFDNIDIYTAYIRVSYFASLWRTQEQACHLHVFSCYVYLFIQLTCILV